MGKQYQNPVHSHLKDQVRKLKEEHKLAVEKKDQSEIDRIEKELNKLARQLGEYITYK